MSILNSYSRTYTLRNRTAGGRSPTTATAASDTEPSPPGYSSGAEERNRRPESDGNPRRSYRDVAASRPVTPTSGGAVSDFPTPAQRRVVGVSPTPVRHGEVGVAANPVETNRVVDSLGPPKVQGVGQEFPGVMTEGLTVPNIYTKNINDTETLSDVSSETDNEWTTVLRKCTRHPKSKKKKVANRNKQPVLNKADPVVEQAAGKLTREQRNKIFRRYDKLKIKESTTNDTSSEHSRGEGPSRLKGKTIDPRNWGGLQLSDAEMDPEIQCAALRAIRDTRKGEVKLKPHVDKETPKSGNKKETPKAKGKERKLVSEVRPSTQIPQDSYLGAVFAKAREAHKKGDTSPSESSSSSESSSDSTSSDSNHSPSRSSTSDPSSHGSATSSSGKQKRKPNQRRSKRGRKKRPTHKTKAIPPKEYNGKADARAYHRFMKEGMAYLEDAKVQPKRYAYTLSCYLTGRAYDFYTQKVSMTEDRWTLNNFFTEMFNYCFPSNYRTQMRNM